MKKLAVYLCITYILILPRASRPAEHVELIKYRNLMIPVERVVPVWAAPSIVDHSDPSITGSLAWAFEKFRGSRTYVLKTTPQNGSYKLLGPLTLPAGAVLKSDDSHNKALIEAVGEVEMMIRLSNSTKIDGVVINGNHKAKILLWGSNIHDFSLSNSILSRTFDAHPNASSEPPVIKIFAHALHIINSDKIAITDNEISYAGYAGVGSNPRYIGASGLSLPKNSDVIVKNNTISEVVSAGIDTTNSLNVTIGSNTISHTGKANYYALSNGLDRRNLNGFFASDGIVAYHNIEIPAGVPSNYLIQNNTITDWYNHGIHIDGTSLVVVDNQVHSAPSAYGSGHAVFIGDYKEPFVCSTNITLKRNYLRRNASVPASDSIRVNYYEFDTYFPEDNTGDVGNPNYVSDHRYFSSVEQLKYSCSPFTTGG